VLVVARTVLQEFAEKSGNVLAPAVFKRVLAKSLTSILPRIIHFENQVQVLREHEARILEQEGDLIGAANALITIPLNSGYRAVTDEYKVKISVKIAQLYLSNQDYNIERAENYLNRAALSIKEIKDTTLQISYKECMASLEDFKRNFTKASLKYYELSQILPEDQRQSALKFAIIGAILAKADATRARILSTLYKDERSVQIPEVFLILEKMFLGRILRSGEVEKFKGELMDHQKALVGDGNLTVLDVAVAEHNLLAASSLYHNISFTQLASLLDISPETAEARASRMISEGRMNGKIDQIERLVYFEHDSEQILHWDSRIERVCSSVNQIIDVISVKYPAFIQK